MPFLLVGFLQILVFWGVHKKQDELLGMLSLQGGESHRTEQMLRRTSRRAWAFGKGLIAGKIISNRRGRQGANVGDAPPRVPPAKADNHPPAENVRERTRTTPPNVDAKPGPTTKSAKPTQAPVERTTLGGRAGHAIGKLVDTPSKVKDKAGTAKDKAKSIPTNAKYAVTQNVGEFRRNISNTPKERRNERKNQREQYRKNVELKRNFTPKPRHIPPENTATYKLNGVPLTREQFKELGDLPPKRREKQDRRERP